MAFCSMYFKSWYFYDFMYFLIILWMLWVNIKSNYSLKMLLSYLLSTYFLCFFLYLTMILILIRIFNEVHYNVLMIWRPIQTFSKQRNSIIFTWRMKGHSMRMRRKEIWRIRISEVRPSLEEVEPAVVESELPHLEGSVRSHEELAPAAHLLQTTLLASLVLEPNLKKKIF